MTTKSDKIRFSDTGAKIPEEETVKKIAPLSF